MADYKELLLGTIGAISDKLRSSTSQGSVRDYYEHGASRAKQYAKITKLSLSLNSDTDELRKIYTEIGKLYYETSSAEQDSVFSSLFSQVTEVSDRIQNKEAELQELKDMLGVTAETDR